MVYQKNNLNLKQPKIYRAIDQKKSSHWPKIIIATTIGIIIASSLLYLVFFSNFFKIKNIEIIGSPSDETKITIEQLKGNNLFGFDKGQIEQDLLKQNRNYLDVTVFRGIPDTIRIKFEDRQPKIIWESQNIKYLVDKDGIIYKIANKENLPLVIDKNNLPVDIPSAIGTTSFIDFINLSNQEFSKIVKVKQFEIMETTFQITVVTNNGFKIMLNTLKPLSEQIDAFNQVYYKNQNDIKDYIDLRVEGWVYYK